MADRQGSCTEAGLAFREQFGLTWPWRHTFLIGLLARCEEAGLTERASWPPGPFSVGLWRVCCPPAAEFSRPASFCQFQAASPCYRAWLKERWTRTSPMLVSGCAHRVGCSGGSLGPPMPKAPDSGCLGAGFPQSLREGHLGERGAGLSGLFMRPPVQGPSLFCRAVHERLLGQGRRTAQRLAQEIGNWKPCVHPHSSDSGLNKPNTCPDLCSLHL